MPGVQTFQPTVDPVRASQHIYDVLVVGAGPAGSSAAYYLASQGADVLLVDRFAFPRNKRCGDAVMPPALEELLLMGIADEMAVHFTPVHAILTRRYDLPVETHPVDPGDHFAVGYVAPRAEFDALLCAHALRAGACWLDQVTIHGLDEQRSSDEFAVVQAVHNSTLLLLKARIVIAADGSGSRLARQLRTSLLERGLNEPLTGPVVPMSRHTALRGYYASIEQSSDSAGTLEFYMHTDSDTYYYWLFPLRNGLWNVGVIAPMEQLRKCHTNLAQATEQFLHSDIMDGRAAHARLEGKLEAAPIWSGMRGTALYGDHILCVGDAAALVHPLTAEGISEALTSGRLAAETALAALARNTFTMEAFSPYGNVLRERYGQLYESLLQNQFP